MFNGTITAIVAYLTLAALLFMIGEFNKLKKENKQLLEEVEQIKKRLDK